MTSRRIVGFAGQQGSGKDTCADFLRKDGFTKYAFAKPLKQFCQDIFDLSHDQLHGPDREVIDPRYNMSPRTLLQKLGTDFFRNMIDFDFWVKYFQRWAANTSDDIVVSDIRFANELNAVREMGGWVFLVRRPKFECSDEPGHVSEHANSLIGYDEVILNDGDLYDLEMKVKSAIKRSADRKDHCIDINADK